MHQLAEEIIELGGRLGTQIDLSKIKTQGYLNFLHNTYFENVDKKTFDPLWLRFHDVVHLIEELIESSSRHTQIWFDYQEKAGAFVKSFDRNWLQYSVTEFHPGDCVLQQHELGKDLLTYKNHNEPMDPEHLNQLAKPWYTLRPTLDIELTEKNNYQIFVENEQEDFLKWLSPYQENWCRYWQISDWQPREMFAKIPLGKIKDLTTITDNFSKGYYPRYIKQ
jgi:hypothetical protein